MKQRLLMALILVSVNLSANILVTNQLGFYPTADKKAYLIGEPQKQIELVSMQDNRTVARYPLVANHVLPDGNRVYVADFSNLSVPGWYYLRSDTRQSAPFEVSETVYQALNNSLVHAFYLQRSGEAVHSPITGMARPPSHTEDGIIFRTDSYNAQGDKFNAAGGWYDAGDFGKYVATTTVSVARLLEAYRQAPQLFVSESTINMPTVLNEALYGLLWLEKMQREDGAVYRKLSGAQWPDKIPPWLDRQPRYVYGVSTPETAKYAATMAFAARIYQRYDKQLAGRFLASAQKAWRFLEIQPQQYIDWNQDDDLGSGPYIFNEHDQELALATDMDDRIWAASELYLATQSPKFYQFIETYYPQMMAKNDGMLDIFEWKNPMILGVWHLIESMDTPLTQTMEKDLHNLAIRYVLQAESSPFYVANQRFIWGSNKMSAEAGIVIALGALLSPDDNFSASVQSQLDYLLGANAFNLSFVTHFGTYSVRHLHHLYQIATGVSLPGFLVGGANIKAQANIAPKDMGMLSYVDDQRSYAVNEFAIDYNAALIGLIAAHYALSQRVKELP